MPQEPYNDDTLMPFGKYKGEPLMDVPAAYFHWLWEQKPISDKRLQTYIEDNMDGLKMENKDLIWSR